MKCQNGDSTRRKFVNPKHVTKTEIQSEDFREIESLPWICAVNNRTLGATFGQVYIVLLDWHSFSYLVL